MALFDFNLDNLDDPKKVGLLSMAAGLMQGQQGRRNFGADLSRGLLGGLQGYSQAQTAERANRANDLQQLTGLYNVVKTRDLMQALQDEQAGRPHIEDPSMKALEAKMAALSGVKSLAAPGAMPPQQMPQQQPQSPPMDQPAPAPQMSTPQNPQFNVPPPQGLLAPPGQSQPPRGLLSQQPQPPVDPMTRLRNSAEIMAAFSGKPELIAQDRFKRSQPTFSRGVAFDSGTGRVMGGLVDNMPVTNNNGRIEIVPNDLTPALAARTGAVAGAKADVAAEHDVVQVPLGNQTVPMLKSDWLKLNKGQDIPQTAPSGQPALTVTPGQQASRDADRVKLLQDELARSTDPGDRAAIQKILSSIPQQPRLGVTPDTAVLAGQKSQQEGIGSTYGKAFEEIRQKGAEAPYQSAMLKEMLALTQGALNGQTGAFAPMRQKWTEYLTSAGVPQKVIDSLPQTIHNLPEAQEFVKLATQRAMSQTRTMGAREAASVFQQVQAANPNMALTSPAMEKIIQPLMAEQEWNFQKHQAADQWLQSHGGNLAGFESTWNREQPFEKFWKGATYAQQQQKQSPGGWSIRKVGQ